MTERVNDMVVKSEEERRRRRFEEQQARQKQTAATAGYEKGTADDPDVLMRDMSDDDNKAHDSDETDSDLADDDDEEMADEPKPKPKQSAVGGSRSMREQEEEEEEEEQATYFVVDSFNIHRLIIAGVTCASKFFSDVFYTNSRYAKVCLLSPLFDHILPLSSLFPLFFHLSPLPPPACSALFTLSDPKPS